ncbi:MAG: aldo/keto reductase [Burkholderiaceae bacterium]
MRQIKLADGTQLPALGLGTWRIGESRAGRAAELAAIRHAIDIGYRLFDTAEMYGEGGAETLLGQALGDALRAGAVTRDELFIVSKVYPHNATRRGTAQACERSLRRLGLARIDLYLLHWAGPTPFAETIDALQALVETGRIGRWGVSNLDIDEMREIETLAPGLCATDQVYYSASQRGPEFSLLPWLREHAMPMMAYSPIDQGGLANDQTLATIGHARGVTAAQVALAWVLAQPGVVAIPKAVRPAHLEQNLAAAQMALTEEELRRIDARFPPPDRKQPLGML